MKILANNIVLLYFTGARDGSSVQENTDERTAKVEQSQVKEQCSVFNRGCFSNCNISANMVQPLEGAAKGATPEGTAKATTSPAKV